MTATAGPPMASAVSAVEVRRLANDATRDVALIEFGHPALTACEFLCECGDLRCDQRVMLTLAEYGATEAGSVRAHRGARVSTLRPGTS